MCPSDNVRNLEASATLAVAARARELRAQGRDLVDLSAGEPDFPTPEPVADAGIAAIREGCTRYTAAAGIPALRQAIARHLARQTGAAVDPAGVVVTAGAKQALFNACFVLFGPGDRVLVPRPYWTSYPALIRLARAQPIEVPGDPAHGFKLGIAELEAAYDPSVRGLILNSPCNPTGAVYSPGEIEAIAAWAARRAVRIISDEIYTRICYLGTRAPGLLDLEPALRQQAVLVGGASKSYSMTGWRIGYSYSDPALAELMAALQSHITSNAATPSQFAALAAYEREAAAHAVEVMAAAFQHRRDLVLELLRDRVPELEYVHPDGAFYLFFRAESFYHEAVPDSVSFCRWLLDEVGLALVPGAAFGDDRYVRLSFAASDAELRAGIARLAAALQPLRAAGKC